MIRIYAALFVLAIVGLAFVATNHPPLQHLGALLIVLAAIALHAHYTQE